MGSWRSSFLDDEPLLTDLVTWPANAIPHRPFQAVDPTHTDVIHLATRIFQKMYSLLCEFFCHILSFPRLSVEKMTLTKCYLHVHIRHLVSVLEFGV